MKKGFKILATLFMAVGIAGCSCSNAGVEIKLNEDKNIAEVDGKAVLTKQGIYDYVKNTAPEAINQAFISKVIDKVLKESSGYTQETYTQTFNYKLKEYFKKNFIENEKYEVNGEFNEKLLVYSLRNDLHKINDPKEGQTGPTYELGLKYDYSEYIKDTLTYEINVDMLKEDYIINVRPTILNNSRSRIITVYETEKVDDMEEIVDKLFKGEYKSLDELIEAKRKEEKEEIERQYCENLGLGSAEEFEYYKPESCSPTKSSYDISYDKFTTCKLGKRCLPQEGLIYQKELIDEEYKIEEKTINKKSEDILYEDAFSHLIREDIDDILLTDEQMKTIFGENGSSKGRFLINGLYNNDAEFNNKDIILSSEPNSTCYIVLVRDVNSSSENLKDKEDAMSALLDTVNEASVLLHYIKKLDIKLIDQELIDSYGDLIK